MKKLYTLILASLFMTMGQAQIQHDGTPINWNSKSNADVDVPYFKTEKLDMAVIQAEDAVVDQYKEAPFRFGVDMDVSLNLFEFGTEITRKNGDKVWRMGIQCPDATSINFVFGEYFVPEGGEVYIWNEDRTEFLGAFTNLNNKEFGSLAIGLIHDEKIVIEYVEPANVAGQALLSVSQISHGYRPVINKFEDEKGPFGTSGSCNMNVNCPDGNDWQEEKRGVALILNGGFVHCTGSLINNVAEDETPYFLTAAHCSGGEANWVMYFNHEYEGCTNTGTADQTQSVSGSTVSATTGPSDAHLVLLSSNVPSDYDPYFNGWDNSGDAVSLGIGIHHPSGDTKKLAFDDDPLTITEYLGTAAGSFDHWRIELWERLTTTEGGSSGSPLFDQNHRIIGQLHGGYANCSNSVDDYYGAMHISWSTLSPYLDPTSTGVATLDGYGPYDITYANDAQAGSVTGFVAAGCEPVPFEASFELKNNGTVVLATATVNYTFNGTAQPAINWTGSLAQDESEILSLGTFTPDAGANNITVTVTTAVDDNAGNNETISNFNGSAADGAGTGMININIIPDDYGSETTWELKNEAGETVLEGGPYVDDVSTPINESYAVGTDLGCYEFTINDAFGDGICCAYGIGSYEITDEMGDVMTSGGEFTDVDVKLISMDMTIGINENSFSQGISIYPNPTQDILNVSLSDALDYRYEVYNVIGELIESNTNNGNQKIQLNVSDYASGMYLLKISSENNTGVKSFTVK